MESPANDAQVVTSLDTPVRQEPDEPFAFPSHWPLVRPAPVEACASGRHAILPANPGPSEELWACRKCGETRRVPDTDRDRDGRVYCFGCHQRLAKGVDERLHYQHSHRRRMCPTCNAVLPAGGYCDDHRPGSDIPRQRRPTPRRTSSTAPQAVAKNSNAGCLILSAAAVAALVWVPVWYLTRAVASPSSS